MLEAIKVYQNGKYYIVSEFSDSYDLYCEWGGKDILLGSYGNLSSAEREAIRRVNQNYVYTLGV